MKKIIPLLIIFLLLAPSVFISAQAQIIDEESVSSDAKVVKAIEVVGNKTISIATILSKIKTRVGQDYIQTVISDDLKRLYNTGYFSDVRVDRQEQDGGFKVIIFVEEKPIIEEITFSKTRYVKTKTLKRKLKSQVGRFLDNKSVKDDIDTIKELYAKKGLNNVEVELEKFVDEGTNKISLHFVIREGQKIRVKAINIYGNSSYPDKKIYKVIKSKKKFWFINQGYLKEDILGEDMDRIVAFYEQNGYIDAQADYSVEKLYKGFININIEINEGKRYSVGSIFISGNQIISNKEINRVMEEIEEGGVFSRAKLTVDIHNIRTLYFDRGYIFANVNESTSLDPETGKVAVRIDIDEGGLAYIEQIKIQGNTRTRDIVIRRELKMLPGDRFDGAKLRRSKDRLNNLGYFEEVGFDIEDTDTYDRKDLVVQVKEAKTGTFSFGGGFSTVDQVVGFIEIQQRNFDFTNWPTFTGGGQQLTLRAETGSNRNNYRLSFTEPWIFDHPVSGGFDIYKTERDRDDDTGYAYDEERTGGGIRFGKQFTEYVSG
ncbi:MAG: outer membrane protein assembly factor BamA, partial [Candidatus Omnitrophica bacterium]|nr:outer membrane protein assembly factor BamA [Candidatus Omnitrophota bacterium]